MGFILKIGSDVELDDFAVIYTKVAADVVVSIGNLVVSLGLEASKK